MANVWILIIHNDLWHRFEPDMLAFSGCYFGGGEKERQELGEIRKRWTTLPVRLQPMMISTDDKIVLFLSTR